MALGSVDLLGDNISSVKHATREQAMYFTLAVSGITFHHLQVLELREPLDKYAATLKYQIKKFTIK